MTPTSINFDQERLATLERLSTVLELFDGGKLAFSPTQYRALARQLSAALQRHEGDAQALQSVLAAHPAAAALYENQHYGVAGLARAPIDAAVASERQATELLARLRA